MIILPRFAIKMKAGYEIDEVLTQFRQHISLDKKELNLYKVDCNADNSVDVLTLNKEINHLESVEWCEPMMIGEVQQYNVLFGSQYYLKNTGQTGGTEGIDINVEPVWNILTVDTTIVVAVIDDGVERNHEDLNGSVLAGRTIDYPDEFGDPKNEFSNSSGSDSKSHGTACAGIIAARNNSIGIRGVASGVKILPINIRPYPYFLYDYNLPTCWTEHVGEAITWAYNDKGADVISCSVGLPNCEYISNALTYAMTYGRNGKGTIVVCSSGNFGSGESSDVRFPANMDGTIAVGAIDKDGVVWNYSCRGTSLDLVAPSGNVSGYGDVVTTDRSAPKGEKPTENYMNNFGGTSAACPQVAGVAALVLSANPDYTANQVRSVLCNSARDLGVSGPDTTYGSGLVNAYAAVMAALCARVWQISGPMIPGSPSTYSVQDLPSGWHVVWSMQGKTTLPSYCTTNYPTANQLQIDNSSKQHIKETLVAKVYNDNWFYVKTLTLYIDTSGSFSGSYTQTIPLPYEVLSGHIYDGNSIWVEQGYDVVMTSSDFYGATVSYTSPSPYPTISTSGNTITVRLHASTMFSNCLLHVVKGDKVIEFRLRANPTILIDPILMANISNEGNSVVNIALSRSEGDVEMRLGDEESWQLVIYNFTTGELVYDQQVSGSTVSIGSSKWTPGVYIVRIKVDGKEIVQKFQFE